MISKHINYRFYRIVVLTLALMLFMPAISIAAEATLKWDPNPAAEDVDGYKVYYGYSSGNYEISFDVGNQTTYTISGLESGQRYYLAVTAYNIEGYESDFSEIVYDVPPSTIDTDSDGDGLTDDDEIAVYKTDPNNADTDGDGITDGNEVEYWGNYWNYDYDNDSIVNLLDPDSDNDGFLDGLELAYESDPSDPDSGPLFPIMETGEVSINHEWQRIVFNNKCFFDPVVVAKSLSYNGADPAILRIQNVNNSGFDIRIQNWDYLDDNHTFETVGYIIMERGSYTLEDGTMVEAGSFTTNNTTSLKTVNFKNSFNQTPVVTTAVVSYNEIDAVLCRTVTNGTNGFEFCLQEQELNPRNHATEEVAYIAWEPSSGIVNSVAFEINIKSGIKYLNRKISFDQTFINSPVFISDMQTINGSDPANVRLESKNAQNAYVKITEEQSRDTETFHRPESVGFMAFSVQ